MRKTFVNANEQRVVISSDDDGIQLVRDGVTREIDPWGEYGMPGQVVVEKLIAEVVAEGFALELPDDLLEQVEAAQEVELTGRVREFYANRTYKSYEGAALGDDTVSFVSAYSVEPFDQSYFDAANNVSVPLLALCSLTDAEGYEDEQHWLGFDPTQADGPIYDLYTSGSYDVRFPSLDALLAALAAG